MNTQLAMPMNAMNTQSAQPMNKAYTRSVRVIPPSKALPFVHNETAVVVKRRAAPALNANPPKKIKAEPSTSAVPVLAPATVDPSTVVQAKAIRVKKEPKVKTEIKVKAEPKVEREPKIKKEPKVKEPKAKAPKVKNEPRPKPTPKPKRKSNKLPDEAVIYLSASMHGRVTRAMKQRMFVMSRELSANDDSVEKFEVLGSVGNNYTVTIGPKIQCTCMDYAIRKTHCKHILMVFLKVYHLPFDSPLFQKLNTSAQQRIEARSTARVVDPSILVPRETRQKILNISQPNHPDATPAIPEATPTRRPLDASDCPICFEEFEQVKIDAINYCQTCGNNVHKECFQMWARSKGNNVTCVYCRSKWKYAAENNATAGKLKVRQLDPQHVHENYYANFADELGISRKRDTSTYYNGRYSGYNYE